MKIVAVEPIGISESLAERLQAEYLSKGHEFKVYFDRREEGEVLAERMGDADIVIVSNIALGRDVLSRCERLKMIDVAFTGIDHIDLDYCREHGIRIMNASGYATVAVSELAVGMMIDLCRRMTYFDSETRAYGTRKGILGIELRGKRAGLVGTGAIGLATAGLLKAFGCELTAYSRSRRQEAEDMGIRYVSLEELMRESDIISLHVPLTEDTKGMISRKMLSLCKPEAILVNTARGSVVDNVALAEALNEGRLAGAAIDVYEKEPPLEEGHPLLGAKNVLLLPHVAYATRESFDKRIDIVLDNLNRYLLGEK